MKISALIFAIIIGISIAKPQFPYYHANSNELAVASSSEEGFDQSVSLSMEEDSNEVALASSKGWEKAAVEHENTYRSESQLDPYKLDATLSKNAQKWAEHVAAKCEMEHASPTQLKAEEAGAESIFYSMEIKADPATFVKSGIDAWFEEWMNYDCGTVTLEDVNAHGSPRNDYYKKVGHFMNTMSMEKTKVGYGFATNPKCGKAFTVARYGGQNAEVFNAAAKKANNQVMKIDLAEMVACVKAE